MTKQREVLLIDDDTIFVFLLETKLKQEEHQLKMKVCAEGQAGVRYIKDHLEKASFPDVIIIDLNMPVLDGWGVLEEFKGINIQKYDIDIYVMSSSISPYDIEKVMQYSFVKNYLVKPLSEEQIKQILNH